MKHDENSKLLDAQLEYPKTMHLTSKVYNWIRYSFSNVL